MGAELVCSDAYVRLRRGYDRSDALRAIGGMTVDVVGVDLILQSRVDLP